MFFTLITSLLSVKDTLLSKSGGISCTAIGTEKLMQSATPTICFSFEAERDCIACNVFGGRASLSLITLLTFSFYRQNDGQSDGKVKREGFLMVTPLQLLYFGNKIE